MNDQMMDKLDRLRNYLTEEDFAKLLEGKLDCKKFLKFYNLGGTLSGKSRDMELIDVGSVF